MLDAAGFERTVILASSELDECLIESMKQQGARVGAWGVGTRLVTGAFDAALAGVYKLNASRPPGGPWRPCVKLSELAAKTSVPGILQVRRFSDESGGLLADCIYDELAGLPPSAVIVDPVDHTRRQRIPPQARGDDLLVPIFRGGRLAYERPSLSASRQRTLDELARLPEGVKRFVNPHRQPVGLEKGLFDLRAQLILEARGLAE